MEVVKYLYEKEANINATNKRLVGIKVVDV